MRCTLIPLLALALAGLGACRPTAPPEAAVRAPAPERATLPVEAFIGGTRMSGLDFNADGSRLLYSSDATGIWNAYSLPVTGGTPRAETQSVDENHHALAWFPDGQRILVERSEGGDDNLHLVAIGPHGHEQDLTPGPDRVAMFARFDRRGEWLYAWVTERDPRHFDLLRIAVDGGQRETVFSNLQGWEYGPVAADGRRAAAIEYLGPSHTRVQVIDLRSGRARPLGAATVRANRFPLDFSADGEWLYYSTDEHGEFLQLHRLHLARWHSEPVLAAEGDILEASVSADGAWLSVLESVDGSFRARLLATANGREQSLPAIPAGEIHDLRLSPDGSRMAFYLNGDRQPNDLHVMQRGEAPRALTRALDPRIAAQDLVDSRVVRFPGSDGLEIPAVLWEPAPGRRRGRAPAVVLVHGGPGGQTTRAFNPLAQLLAHHGYVVLGVNNRGSSGYGKTFFAADDGRHGREPLWDCIAGKRYLQSLAHVDPQRIGILGNSYGGYMVLAALAFAPDEFQAGVDLYGVSNWLRTLEQMPAHWESFREALYQEIGDPRHDRDALIAISPLFHAERIRAPLLVLQGANDPRVLQVESDEIVAAVRRNGVPVEYRVFADEGHGITKKANLAIAYRHILDFLGRNLGADGEGPLVAD